MRTATDGDAVATITMPNIIRLIIMPNDNRSIDSHHRIIGLSLRGERMLVITQTQHAVREMVTALFKIIILVIRCRGGGEQDSRRPRWFTA